jgi:hypothetical protein
MPTMTLDDPNAVSGTELSATWPDRGAERLKHCIVSGSAAIFGFGTPIPWPSVV